jgi:hypothetical protein
VLFDTTAAPNNLLLFCPSVGYLLWKDTTQRDHMAPDHQCLKVLMPAEHRAYCERYRS